MESQCLDWTRHINTGNLTTIAQEDYQFAWDNVFYTTNTLNRLKTNLGQQINNLTNGKIQGNRKELNELIKQLQDTKTSIENEIDLKIKEINNSNEAKRKTLSDFTIGFMGRTKAGKSTLHAIIAGDGWEAIGKGKQRTTRENREYKCGNLRIIDTPGIGAPGGKSDEEIATSIVDEVDLICYVVTNDSIQESEFNFLKLLKGKNKPLIILLNIKNNLRDSRRLQYFLKEPTKLFAMEGNSGLGGHIERIRRYAKEHYNNGYFPIIPVMLLAGQMSKESEHKNDQQKLWEASRIEDFLKAIGDTVIKHGMILRSQTLLGSTSKNLEQPIQWLEKQIEKYQKSKDTVSRKKSSFENKTKKAQTETNYQLKQAIREIFADLDKAIRDFAENNWEAETRILNDKWQKKLISLNFESRLKTAYQEAGINFQRHIQETLEEITNELQLIADLQRRDFKLQKQDSDDSAKNFFRFGGGLLSIAGAVSTIVFPPIALGALIVGGIMSFFGNLFKSREEKRREAVAKISNSLKSQVKEYERQILNTLPAQFDKNCDELSNKVTRYFQTLQDAPAEITRVCEDFSNQLKTVKSSLDRAYAKRIIDWTSQNYEKLSPQSIDQCLSEVKRTSEQGIYIKTKQYLDLKIDQEKMKQTLQEDINISTPPKPYQKSDFLGDKYQNNSENKEERQKSDLVKQIIAKGAKNLNLSGVNLSGVNLRRANLSGVNLSQANLRAANLTNANLRGANLRGANLIWANLTNADLLGADLYGADLTNANLHEANLKVTNLNSYSLGDKYQNNSENKEERQKSDLVKEIIANGAKNLNLDGVNLSGVNLSGADLGRANLSGVNLSGANLSEVNLSGANLSGANLSDADLYRANLSQANLSGANLSKANSHGANLINANLRGANLRGANLNWANLNDADLLETDLYGANLTNTDLSGANLSGAHR